MPPETVPRDCITFSRSLIMASGVCNMYFGFCMLMFGHSPVLGVVARFQLQWLQDEDVRECAVVGRLFAFWLLSGAVVRVSVGVVDNVLVTMCGVLAISLDMVLYTVGLFTGDFALVWGLLSVLCSMLLSKIGTAVVQWQCAEMKELARGMRRESELLRGAHWRSEWGVEFFTRVMRNGSRMGMGG